MEQNKVRTYILYALGEILLVIIGILIALQINNMNELAKERAKVDKILLDMREELKQEVELIRPAFLLSMYIDSLQADFLRSNYTANDFNTFERNQIPQLANWYSSVNPPRNTYLSLMDNKSIIPADYDSLLVKLDLHYVRIYKYLTDFDESVSDIGGKYIAFRKDNFEWFGLNDNTTEANEYYASDWRHRNNVAYHRRINNVYIRQMMFYRETALIAYNEISGLFDLEPVPDLPYMQESNLKQFEGDYQRVTDSGDTLIVQIVRKGNMLVLQSSDAIRSLQPLADKTFYTSIIPINDDMRFFEFRDTGNGRLHLFEETFRSLQEEISYEPIVKD